MTEQFDPRLHRVSSIPTYEAPRNQSYSAPSAAVNPGQILHDGSPVEPRIKYSRISDYSSDLRKVASRQASHCVAAPATSASIGPARTVLHDPLRNSRMVSEGSLTRSIYANPIARQAAQTPPGSNLQAESSDRGNVVRRDAAPTFSDLTDEEVRAAKNPLVPHCQFPGRRLRTSHDRRTDDATYIEELEAASSNASRYENSDIGDLLRRAYDTLLSYQNDRIKPVDMRDYPTANTGDPPRHAIASSAFEVGHPRASHGTFHGHEPSHRPNRTAQILRDQVLASKHGAHVQFGQQITPVKTLDGVQEQHGRV